MCLGRAKRRPNRCHFTAARAAEAKGDKGRRPAVPAGKSKAVRTAYLEGRSIDALARDHDVCCAALGTAVADLLPEHTAVNADTPVVEVPVLGVPGKSTSSAPPIWRPSNAPRSTRA
ncbi:hypothetical protein ACFWJY_08370 [Streptomyces anulatus]|uniref:hypothetical protein n=1 Tax=Streptomyces anulatus TaxID=1892 RepID=UPI0036615D45